MRVFSRSLIPACDAPGPAAGAVLRVARQEGLLNGPWSLAELRPDEDDFNKLRAWAGNLDPAAVRRWLGAFWWHVDADGLHLTGQAAFGVLLLFLSAEVGRREATEHTLWPFVRRDRQGRSRFSPLVERELFIQGQPSEGFKDAVEAAARQLELLHVFGQVDTQHYYSSVSLQFGLPRRHLETRLPGWLVGQAVTDAMCRLLQEGPLRSTSFSTLWDALRQYRFGNITDQRLRHHLEVSPWVLPEWIDVMLEAARTARTIRESTIDPNDMPDEPMPLPFLDEPTLRWQPPEVARFTCRLVNLAALDLTEDVYDVLIAGRRVVRLLRQPDGDYSQRPAGEVVLPVIASEVAANLVGGDGAVACSQTLTLWNSADDVTVYRLPAGNRLAEPCGARMNPQTAYAVRHSRDLSLTPGPDQWETLEDNANRLSLLSPGWSPDTRLCIQGDILWNPLTSRNGTPPEPAWLASVDVTGTSCAVHFGQSFEVRITHSSEVAVTFVRGQGRALEFAPDGEGATRACGLRMNPGQPSALDLAIGLRRETEAVCVRRRLTPNVWGVARLDASVWMVLDGQETLTVEQARLQPFRMLPPSNSTDDPDDLHAWAIIEGNLWVGRPARLPQPIGTVAGLGASLRVVRGPYNIVGDHLEVAREVVDHGILRDVIRDGRTARLELTIPVEPDSHHQVVWWDAGGGVTIRVPRSCRDGENVRHDWWALDLPAGFTEPLAVGVGYLGMWLGGWWRWDWAEDLAERVVPTVEGIAVLVRWLRLPVLSRASLPPLRELVRRHPVELLRSWLFDEAPTPLCWRVAEPGWLAAVGEMFQTWHATPADVQELLRVVAAVTHAPDPIVPLALRLMDADPQLMGRVVRRLAEGLRARTEGANEVERVLTLLIREVARRSDDTEAAADADLVRNIANDMRVDEAFVRALAQEGLWSFWQGHALHGFQGMNLAVSICTLEPFRRLLALRILRWLADWNRAR